MANAKLPKTVAGLRRVSVANLRPVTMPDGTKHQLTESDWSRFLRKSGRTRNGCWVWAGGRLPTGYGKFSIKRGEVYVHRLAYMIFVDDIPEGLHIDHLCRNRTCYNPAHLEPVTCAENIRRSPIHMSVINAQKTECIRGHLLSGENLMLGPAGQRRCRTCHKAACSRRYANVTADLLRIGGKRKWPGSVEGGTKCRNGHPLTDGNIYTSPKGWRRCRQCQIESAERRNSRSQGATNDETPGNA